jgi:hypothetical protein
MNTDFKIKLKVPKLPNIWRIVVLVKLSCRLHPGAALGVNFIWVPTHQASSRGTHGIDAYSLRKISHPLIEGKMRGESDPPYQKPAPPLYLSLVKSCLCAPIAMLKSKSLKVIVQCLENRLHFQLRDKILPLLSFFHKCMGY